MANILSGQKRVVIAAEATYGVDQVNIIHGDGDLDLIYQDVQGTPSITPAREIVEISRARSSASGVPHKSLPRASDVELTLALAGRIATGAGNEAPYYSAALLASGHSETVVSDTTATYAPKTAKSSGMTVYLYHELDDGKQRLQRATGVRGNANIVLELDQEARLEFSGRGQYVDVLSDAEQFFNATTGVAALEGDGSTAVTSRAAGSEDYAAKDPIMVRAITVTVNGNSWCVSAMNFNTNWTLTERNCATGAAGLKEVILTRGDGQRAGGSFTLDTDSETVIDDFIDLYESAEEIAFTVSLTSGDGSSGEDQITISASKAQIGAPGFGDNSGVVQFDIPFYLNGDWSDLFQDDDYSLVYGEVS